MCVSGKVKKNENSNANEWNVGRIGIGRIGGVKICYFEFIGLSVTKKLSCAFATRCIVRGVAKGGRGSLPPNRRPVVKKFQNFHELGKK